MTTVNFQYIYYIALRARENPRIQKVKKDTVFHTPDFSPTCEKNINTC